MANVVLGVVGAVIGSFTPAGPWVGFAIGSAVGSLLFPSGADQKGPRLNDLKIESSAYGTPIPIVYGSARVGGAIIWATDLVEHEHEEGGKGGPTVTTYTYSASFAVSVCEGPIAGIRRIWSMGTLIYDVSGESEETALPNLQLTIYLGTEDQMPDPTIESYLGAGNVPAYRGQAYVVFTDLDLSNYGNSLAGTQLEFEVVTKAVPASESATLNAWGNTTGFMSRDPVTGYLYAPNGGSVVVYDPATETIVQTIALSPLGLNATAAPYGIVYGNGTMFVGDAEGDWYGHVGWSIDCATNVATVINGQSTNPFQGGLYFSPGVPSTEGVFFNTGLSGGSWDVYRNIDGVPDSPQMAGVALSPDGLTEVFWAVGVPNQLLINLLQPEGGGWQFVFTPINPDWPSSDGFNDGALLAFDDTNRIIYWGNKHQTGVYAVDLGTGAVSQVLSGITPIFLLYSPDTGRLYVQDATNGYFSSYQKSGATFTLLQAYSGATITSTGGQHTTGIYVGGETWAVATSTGGTANTSLWTVRFPEGAILNGLPVLLKDIVSDLSVRTERLTTADIDVTELTDLVDGYVVSRQAPARACIEQLQQAYFFDAVESQDIIRFRKRGQASLVTIPREDLAAHVVGQELPDALSVTRKQEVELPQIIDLNYISQDGDYQTGTQRNRRMATLSGDTVSVELPIVMSEDKAKQVVDTLMYNAWTERMACSFQTSRKYAAYEPTDVMTVEATDIRIVKKVESDGIIKWEGVPERAYVYTQLAGGAQLGGIPIQGVPQLQAAEWVLLDLPLLRDADDDPGFYLAARGSGSPWPGMALFKSADGGATYTEIERTTTASPMGTATTALGDFEGGNVTDELNTVTVTLTGGTLSSVSALAVLNGANAAALASGDGWEILQYKRAALNDDGSYTLSGLLRGRRGTEWAMGGHAVGDRFVVLSTALSRIDGTLGEIGLARDFKGVTVGMTLASAQPREFTPHAEALTCYSPVLLGGGRDASNNLTINWVRRTRIGGEWIDNVDVPLSEAFEKYDVEITNAGFTTVLRTFSGLTEPTATYTAAQQTADGITPGSAVHVRVYQVGECTGRGTPTTGTL